MPWHRHERHEQRRESEFEHAPFVLAQRPALIVRVFSKQSWQINHKRVESSRAAFLFLSFSISFDSMSWKSRSEQTIHVHKCEPNRMKKGADETERLRRRVEAINLSFCSSNPDPALLLGC